MSHSSSRLSTMLGIIGLLFPISLQGVVTTGPPDDYLVPAGQGLDGVTKLLVETSTASFLCSGALLGTGRHVLTAAHCVTDPLGRPDLVWLAAFFETPELVSMILGTRAFVHPAYTGELTEGHDLAIISLATPAPTAINRYSIYSATDEVGRAGLIAGYGATGQGKRDLTIPGEAKRAGWNRFDATGETFGFAGADGLLLYDFDNGRAANDGFGFFVPKFRDLGEGRAEVLPTIGDSGGPTFLNGAIAGIHSFGFRAQFTNGRTSDVDSQRNQSFGEFGADVRVSLHADWIDRTSAVPEPATFLPVLTVLIALAVVRKIVKSVR